MKKRVTIKTINQHSYVYEWEYIPKIERTNEKKRFQWIYKGPLSGKGGEYIKSFTNQENLDAAHYVYDKAWKTLLKREMKELEKTPLFYDRIIEISTLGKVNGVDKILELREEIETVAEVYVNQIIGCMTPEEFWDFLKGGGTIGELIKDKKVS